MEAGAAGRVARGWVHVHGCAGNQAVTRPAWGCEGMWWQCDNLVKSRGRARTGGWRGWTKKKTMLTDGMEGGMELIDPLSAFCSEDHWQTEAPVFITCNVNVTMRTLHLGYGNVHQTLQFSMFAWCRRSGCKEATAKRFSEMHSNLLNDWKIIMYSQLIISRIAADWEHNQDGRFVFTGFLTCCWRNKSHLVSRIVVLWESRISLWAVIPCCFPGCSVFVRK